MTSTEKNNRKLVFIGDSGGGKTCLIAAHVRKALPEEIPRLFDNHTENLLVNGENYTVQIWDTANGECYGKLRPLMYPQTTCFVIVFSLVPNQHNFEDSSYKHLCNRLVNEWIAEIKVYR
jgi:Ras-related protein Rab-7A